MIQDHRRKRRTVAVHDIANALATGSQLDQPAASADRKRKRSGRLVHGELIGPKESIADSELGMYGTATQMAINQERGAYPANAPLSLDDLRAGVERAGFEVG